VEEQVPGAKVRFVEHKEDDRSYRVDFDKVNHILDWDAKRTIQDGVAEIREWMLENDIRNYEANQYRNSEYPYM
jgi:dTDP-D-glucose 4,6-dehydratase